MAHPSVRLGLVDDATRGERTTAALLASLTARLTVLRTVTGSEAVGSMMAGLAHLGREIAGTADGARMRAAIEATVAANGEAIWTALSLDTLADSVPTPMLAHLRNDVALLVADDLEEALDGPMPAATLGAEVAPPPDDGDEDRVIRLFCDYLLGMWALSGEVRQALEALVADALVPTGAVLRGEGAAADAAPLLR